MSKAEAAKGNLPEKCVLQKTFAVQSLHPALISCQLGSFIVGDESSLIGSLATQFKKPLHDRLHEETAPVCLRPPRIKVCRIAGTPASIFNMPLPREVAVAAWGTTARLLPDECVREAHQWSRSRPSQQRRTCQTFSGVTVQQQLQLQQGYVATYI